MIKSNEKARLDFMGYEMDLLEREMKGREDMRKEMEMDINKKNQELEKMQNEIIMLKKQIAMMS
jgi:hypothetical protein